MSISEKENLTKFIRNLKALKELRIIYATTNFLEIISNEKESMIYTLKSLKFSNIAINDRNFFRFFNLIKLMKNINEIDFVGSLCLKDDLIKRLIEMENFTRNLRVFTLKKFSKFNYKLIGQLLLNCHWLTEVKWEESDKLDMGITYFFDGIRSSAFSLVKIFPVEDDFANSSTLFFPYLESLK